MAPQSKAQQSQLQAGASDSEDDLATATATNKAAKTTKNAKTKAMPRKQPAEKKTATKRKATPAQSDRQALKDRTNVQDGASDAEEGDDGANEAENAKPKAKRTKTSGTRKQAAPRAGAKSKATKPAAEEMEAIPETQPEQGDVTWSVEGGDENMEVAVEPSPPRQQRKAQRPPMESVPLLQPRASARAGSVQPHAQPLQVRPSARSGSAPLGHAPGRERSGSVSGTERERRGGDPELRRKLNDVNQKYENLSMKYQSLQELGHDDGESNFEKLKRASDQKAKDANDLIASLKKEIADLKKSSASKTVNDAETASLQKQVASLNTTNTKLTTEATGLKSNLQASQNETKSLEAKLIAARQQLSNSNSAPETNDKSNNAEAKSLSRSVGPTSNTSEAAKEAKMKENLYSDLTGLIIRGVKRKDGEDEYDCIQTGRNGTLHFHLSVATDTPAANPKTPSGLSYEDAEFAYEPLLDESRDRDLLALLPDYLAEEICFPRSHAVRFYTKVVESLTKKVVIEEEEEEEDDGE